MIHQLAHLRLIDAVHTPCKHLYSLHRDRRIGSIGDRCRCRLQPHRVELSPQLLDFFVVHLEPPAQHLCGPLRLRAANDPRRLKAAPKLLKRPHPRDRLDPPDVTRHRALPDQLDQANLPGSLRVRTSAKLRRKVADPHHAHPIAILFAEQRHRAVVVHRGIDRHIDHCLNRCIRQHLGVDDALDLGQLLLSDAGEVRKVEAEPRLVHQRPGLLHMLAQHRTQRRMQQMRAGMVAHRRRTHRAVHDRIDRVANQ